MATNHQLLAQIDELTNTHTALSALNGLIAVVDRNTEIDPSGLYFLLKLILDKQIAIINAINVDNKR